MYVCMYIYIYMYDYELPPARLCALSYVLNDYDGCEPAGRAMDQLRTRVQEK